MTMCKIGTRGASLFSPWPIGENQEHRQFVVRYFGDIRAVIFSGISENENVRRANRFFDGV